MPRGPEPSFSWSTTTLLNWLAETTSRSPSESISVTATLTGPQYASEMVLSALKLTESQWTVGRGVGAGVGEVVGAG